MKFLNDMNTAKAKVEMLLKLHPPLRDSDKLLWVSYLQRHCGLSPLEGENLKRVLMKETTPTMESISRARRLIQAGGRFQGTRRAERLETEVAVRESLSIGRDAL